MYTAKLRKSGNSLIVTVPKEEAERLHLKEGQTVLVDVRQAEIRPVMAPDLREEFEVEFQRGLEGLRYLAE